MRATLASLMLTIPGLAAGQPALIESTIGRSGFGFDTVGIEAGHLAGDARDDLLLRRAALDGDFAELWIRESAAASGFVLGQALPSAAVRGQLITDIDFDGDSDLVIATADPADSILLWINQGDAAPPGEPRFVRSAQRHAYAGITSLAASYFVDNAAAPPFRAGALLTRAGAPNVALRYDGAGGLVALPTSFPHAGGAVAMASLVGDAGGRGFDHMSFGAPPQRLWLSSNTSFAYTERVVDEITANVVAALCTDFDRDGDSDLLLATSTRNVEVWDNQAGEFTLRQSIAIANAASIEALVLIDIEGAAAPAHPDLAVSHTSNAATPVKRTTLHRFDAPSGLFVARNDDVLHAAAFGSRGTGASARLYLGERGTGVRVLQPRTGPLDPVTLQFDGTRAYGVSRLPTGLPIRTNLPSPAFVNVTAPPAGGVLRSGLNFGMIDVPFALTRTPGMYSFTLAQPASPLVTLGAPITIDLYMFENFDVNAMCAVECFVAGNCPTPPAAKVGRAKGASPYLGTAAQVQTLRDFRNLVLRDSPKGLEYETFYDRFESELYTVTLMSPSFFLELGAAKDAWMPAIESLVAGPADVVITAEMADVMDNVFAHFRSRGSRTLRETIERQYALLDPRARIGSSIGSLRDAWEAMPPDTVFASGFEGP